MKPIYIILIVVAVVLVILIGLVISAYNSLVVGRNRVKNSFAQIDVQLTRRFDLIPNLVETVKGYTKHEESIFGEFAKARSLYDRARDNDSVEGLAQADSALSKTLGKLIMVTEAYPELKADQNYAELMDSINDTEDKIAFTRQFYNDVVLSYNNSREMFPKSIIAGMFKFKEAELFKAEEEQRKSVKVKF